MPCVLAMFVLSAACQSQAPLLSLNVIAERYLAAVQALALHDPSLVDHWLAESPVPTEARRPVRELIAEVSALDAQLEQRASGLVGVERARHDHLHAQVRALLVAARRLMGESFSFDEEARLAFGIEPFGGDLERFDAARRQLNAELAGPGPLGERLIAFREQFSIPPQLQEKVMRVALERCRAAAGPALALPAGESIELRFTPVLGWDAHARYLGGHRSLIEINSSRHMDLTRALRLACHEGYPGHHTQHLWMHDELAGRRGWAEFRLVPGFGRQLLVAEGAAEAGTDLAMPSDRRLAEYRDHLAPAAGLSTREIDRLVRVEDLLTEIEPVVVDIAREYLDNRIGAERARERLREEALVADPDTMLPFIERQRTKVLAYPAGRALVSQSIGPEGLFDLRAGFVDRVLFSATDSSEFKVHSSQFKKDRYWADGTGAARSTSFPAR